jgi:uncharacterized membrane protein
MILVTLYSRVGCAICAEAETELKSLQKEIPYQLKVVDIDSDASLGKAFALEIPVLEVRTFQLKAPFSRQDAAKFLKTAANQAAPVEQKKDKVPSLNGSGSQRDSDRFSYWLSKHYLAMINLLLLFYVGVPFLAPVFKKAGWNAPAEVIYKIYSPLCHQWAFRSFFLFGEQAYYPHAAARMPGTKSFEQVSSITDLTDPGRFAARAFEGTPVLGYKVAFCERDVAIWGAMLLFGLFYAATGRRLPKLHWVVWILVGMLPVGLDGFSQLFSQIPVAFIQTYLPYRESTPFLRSLTGFLFGFTTAWFMIPLIEESMAETRRVLSTKFVVQKSL